jgi:hypothetical protein
LHGHRTATVCVSKDESGDSVQFLETSSAKIGKIAIPVVITLLCDAACVRFLEQKHGTVQLSRSIRVWMSYSDTSKGVDAGFAIYFAVVLLIAILVVTVVLLVLYLGNCVTIIYVWMIFAVSSILSCSLYICFGWSLGF